MSRKDRRNPTRPSFGTDISGTLAEVQKIRAEVTAARAEVAETTRTVTSGPVTATVNGEGKLVEIHIDPAAALEALSLTESILDAINAAHEEVGEFAAERLAPYTALADIV